MRRELVKVEEVVEPVPAVDARQGTITVADFSIIEGWVSGDTEGVAIDLYDGETFLASTRPGENTSPEDQARLQEGRSPLAFRFHDTLFPMARHVVRVCYSDTLTDLEGSPFVLERGSGPLDSRGLRSFEQMIAGQIATARSQVELDATLELLIEQVGQVASARSRLGRAAREPVAPVPTDQLSSEFARFIDRMQATYPHIDLPTSAVPMVSIIIPVYNQFGFTYQCIHSILSHLPSVPFEVIIVDDKSTDETTLARLSFGDGVRIHRNVVNGGFIKSCNTGASLAKGDFLYFLNNDTKVLPGFIDTLVATFASVDNVGVAGSKLLFPDGRLQECGGIIWRMADGWNWGRDQDPLHPRFSYLRDSDWVSGAALMIPRKLFEEMKGFDELYLPAYYEDTDLCFRVRAKGKRVVVQPSSGVIHFEGVSNGTDTAGTGVKRHQITNQRKFLKRWQDTLSRHRFNGQMPELEAERTVTKRALFLDDTVPTPDQDAGSNAAIQHMRSLQRLGYKVTFVPGDNMARIDPYTQILQGYGIECLYHPFHPSVEDILKRVTPKYDLVYLHRYSNAAKYAGLVRQHCPKARVVYNVADLHYLRVERQAEVEGSDALRTEAARLKRGELAAMAMVDAVIVHSDHEADVLANELTDEASIYVVPWTVPATPLETLAAERTGIGFLGGYQHVPNVDAAEWLAQEIMPRVNMIDPNIICYLAGSKMPDRVANLAGPNLRTVGWVKSAGDFYSGLRLSIAPLRYGAGVKGKVLESFAAGIPCIMTPIAAEGIPLTNSLSRLIAADTDRIADMTVALYSDTELVDALSQECRKIIETHYSAVAIDRIMSHVLTG